MTDATPSVMPHLLRTFHILIVVCALSDITSIGELFSSQSKMGMVRGVVISQILSSRTSDIESIEVEKKSVVELSFPETLQFALQEKNFPEFEPILRLTESPNRPIGRSPPLV